MRYSGISALFMGHPLTSVELESQTNHYTPWRDEKEMFSTRSFFPTVRDYNMSFSLIVPTDADMTFQYNLLTRNILSLGTGKQCGACGTYWPTGNYVCFNCGYELGDYPYIRPHDWDMMIDTVNMGCSVEDWISMDITASGNGSPDMQFLGGLDAKLDFCTTPHATIINDGYYLCPWCGLAAETGKDCYGCGGPRTPLRELVDMKHECVWCGNKTVNGIMCEQCGTRVGGRTIEDELQGEQK